MQQKNKKGDRIFLKKKKYDVFWHYFSCVFFLKEFINFCETLKFKPKFFFPKKNDGYLKIKNIGFF